MTHCSPLHKLPLQVKVIGIHIGIDTNIGVALYLPPCQNLQHHIPDCAKGSDMYLVLHSFFKPEKYKKRHDATLKTYNVDYFMICSLTFTIACWIKLNLNKCSTAR